LTPNYTKIVKRHQQQSQMTATDVNAIQDQINQSLEIDAPKVTLLRNATENQLKMRRNNVQTADMVKKGRQILIGNAKYSN